MNIKSDKTVYNKYLIGIVVLIAIALSYSLLSFSNSFGSNEVATTIDDLRSPTKVKGLGHTFEDLLKGSESLIFENSDLKIYEVTKSGKAHIVYAYKQEPKGRALTDKFFLHLYVKDSTKLNGDARFVNVDFFQQPQVVKVDGKNFYVYNKELISSHYVGKEVPFSAIDHIRTGRNKPGVDRSLDLGKIPLSGSLTTQLNSNLDKITLIAKSQDFNKILNKRNEALEIGVLSTGDNDIMKGKIRSNNGQLKEIEYRLKGDWADHLKDRRKWSYRVILQNGETLKGMRKFSIQHPKVRNYLWEWLFNKLVKDEDIIGLRYDFAEVDVQIEKNPSDKIPLGIMAIEESFDKILIENNKKREGIIIAFDESIYWSDVKKQRELQLDGSTYSKKIRDVASSPIKVFNENKVLSTPELHKQFETARDLLDGLRKSKYKISEVFDMEKLTMFVALNNLFNGNHGLVWHNLRIYYNPITAKLEPISFDSNAGTKISKITHYPFAENDSLYQSQVLEKLKIVSSSAYINTFITKYKAQLNSYKTSLFTEFSTVFNPEILEYNSNFIKKQLNPSLQITASLIDYDELSMLVEVNNLAEYPVVLKDLYHEDGVILSDNQTPIVLKKDSVQTIRLKLNKYFVNAFVSKKNKKGTFKFPNDVSKLRLEHYIKGVGVKRQSDIAAYSVNRNLGKSVKRYRDAQEPNLNEFAFIEVEGDSVISFKTGNYILEKNLVIPADYKVVVDPGFNLDFKNKSSIKSHSALISKGTSENLIKFFSSDSTGQGIFVTNARDVSEIAFTHFENLSNPSSNIWSVSGAVNFHESEVTITNSHFSNNRCEDALNIIRTKFEMTETVFENTQSDSFDGDFVDGTLSNCSFINSGNDGIDVSGSTLILENIQVKNPSDKAISAGEHSTIKGDNIKITGGEIGVVSKDLSTIDLTNLKIINTRLGLSAFQKKSEYGMATIRIEQLNLENIEVPHLIEINSSLTIDSVPVETVSNNVIDQMYGKEYGKSSR